MLERVVSSRIALRPLQATHQRRSSKPAEGRTSHSGNYFKYLFLFIITKNHPSRSSRFAFAASR
jgi:hypothetical protein